jgi:diguanylate cyclase (GGDEF)-like protein
MSDDGCSRNGQSLTAIDPLFSTCVCLMPGDPVPNVRRWESKGDSVSGYAIDVERLDAALLGLEDQFNWDSQRLARHAAECERQARRLGDELLLYRARLCGATAQMRAGDLGGAARGAWEVQEWATGHHARQLRARTHMVWANIHCHLGDFAQCLEQVVLAVELLDDESTPHMHVWYRAKLADALGQIGSMADARIRYAQAEELATKLDKPRLRMAMLNNYAYTELAMGEAELAERVAERLRECARTYGFELSAAVLDTLGAIAVENGRYAEAERTMHECIARDENDEDADAMAEYLLTLARAQRGLGATDRAQVSLAASRAQCEERQLGEVLVRVHLEQAELHAARGEYAEAFAAHKVFFAAHESLHSAQREAQARARQAMFETAEAREEADRFREQARRDPLTGLRNRRYLDEQLPAMIEAGGELTVAIADLDHFKRINDQLSHDVGDQVLMRAAKLLETELAAVVPDGFVARMGGEEFLLVLPGIPSRTATVWLDGIRRAVRSHGWTDVTGEMPVTVSIGVAGLDDSYATTQAALLSDADRYLYEAKHAGRDRVVNSASCECAGFPISADHQPDSRLAGAPA